MKLSLILPVYNTSIYLDRCIESCINDELGMEYEIILVNDGSSDDSLIVCEKYKNKYPGIVIINKKNAGISAARNDGIKIAKGEYVFFLDSDDYLQKGSVEILISDIRSKSSFDLISYNFISQNENVVIENSFEWRDGDVFLSFQEKLELIFGLSNISNWSPWGKLFKKSIIIENRILFNEKNYGSEDLEFNFNLLPYISSATYREKRLVSYTINNANSVTKNVKYATLINLLRVIGCISDEVKVKCEQKSISFCTNVLADWFIFCLIRYRNYTKEESVKLKTSLKDTKKVLNGATSFEAKTCRILCNLFGIRLTSAFISFYKARKRKSC